MTTKVNVAGKTAAGFESVDCNFERSSAVGKILSALPATEK